MSLAIDEIAIGCHGRRLICRVSRQGQRRAAVPGGRVGSGRLDMDLITPGDTICSVHSQAGPLGRVGCC